MKYIFIIFLLPLINSNAQTTKIMTYNIRLDVASDGVNRWDNRKEILAGQVKFYEPDFLGVQEALPTQMQYLKTELLNNYQSIGVGRDDGKDQGEYSAIFYNNIKYKMLEQSTFWLSETPDIVSLGWDARYKRVCTYSLFENKATKEKIWVFNTHFDHIGDIARTKSAELILQKIKELNKLNLPFVLMGDFNLEQNSEPIQLITQQLADSKYAAKQVFGPSGTFNAFEFNKPVTKRIDYIFTSKTGLEITKYAVLSDSIDCRYPSDHLPVYIEIILK